MPQISSRQIACMAGAGLRSFYLLFFLLLAWGCDSDLADRTPDGMARVEGGTFRIGSDAAERELGYQNSPEIVREYGWYDAWEADSHKITLGPFAIDRTPVTRAEYAAFVAMTGHRVPDIDSAAYQAQGFLVHPWSDVEAFLWDGERPSDGLGSHPVVLVDFADAAAYCRWRGERDGHPVRLPTGPEWEAACRGAESRMYAWGNEWRETAAVAGTTFTAPVGSHLDGATPDGIQDLLGNVFEWTSSRMPPPESREPVLRGCGWDDAPGTCRCAFRHGRPATSRHILIGFRCASTRNVRPPTR